MAWWKPAKIPALGVTTARFVWTGNAAAVLRVGKDEIAVAIN